MANFASLSGLKAAYAFDEGSGTTTVDRSGFNNTGTLVGATWTTQGRFGKALQFNGTSALVTAPDSPSLHLTSAMTLECWVFPTAVPLKWSDLIMKANDDYYLEATSPMGRLPAMSSSFTSPLYGTTALTVNTWSHLAATYDGAMMKLYLNGVVVSSRAQTGTVPATGGPLSFGGDAQFGQYFAGRIDEVRIYDHALSATEIQSDMMTPVPTVDAPEPSTPRSSAILGAFPNPFNPSTRIRLRLASVENAKLRVFDVAGRLVYAFDLRQFSPGEHDLVWRGTDSGGRRVAGGVYVARLDAADEVHSMRIIVGR